MSFQLKVGKIRTIRENLEVEEMEVEKEFDILKYYRDTLSRVYGGVENIPPLKERKRRRFQFTSKEEDGDCHINLNRCQMSMVRGETFKGNWFIYLITLPSTVSSKTDSHIGWTTNPLVDVYLLNVGQTIYKHTDRNITMAIPNWKLRQVIGTLTCEEQAEDFAYMWVHGTRGQKSKQAKASFLTEAADATLYTFSESLRDGETMESLLTSLEINEEFRTFILDELNREK